MNEVEFKKDFIEDVKAGAVSSGLGTTAEFVQNMADSLIQMDVLSDFVPVYYSKTGHYQENYVWMVIILILFPKK